MFPANFLSGYAKKCADFFFCSWNKKTHMCKLCVCEKSQSQSGAFVVKIEFCVPVKVIVELSREE